MTNAIDQLFSGRRRNNHMGDLTPWRTVLCGADQSLYLTSYAAVDCVQTHTGLVDGTALWIFNMY